MFTYPYAILHNYQNALMHKSEPRVNSTLITMPKRYISSEQGPLGSIRVLTPSGSNYEVDSTSYYKE